MLLKISLEERGEGVDVAVGVDVGSGTGVSVAVDVGIGLSVGLSVGVQVGAGESVGVGSGMRLHEDSREIKSRKGIKICQRFMMHPPDDL